MKQCPKCYLEHNLNGKFCSRKCANSRVFSAEAKQKKSKAQKKYLESLPKNVFEERKSVLFKPEVLKKKRQVLIDKSNSRNWDEIGWDSKRIRVIKEQENKCNECGVSEWRGEPLSLEVDHKNGNNKDNTRENLEALCPNCHSLTKTWRGRNKQTYIEGKKVSDEKLLEALKEESNIRKALIKVGLAAKGGNYERCKKVLNNHV